MSNAGKKGDRITVAEVRAAYAATGLEAVRGCFFDTPESWRSIGLVPPQERWCGCPATAVAALRSGDPKAFLGTLRAEWRSDERAVLVALGVSNDYLNAFTEAVDGTLDDGSDGGADGAAVRAALWPAVRAALWPEASA